jgi:hypothetical protein
MAPPIAVCLVNRSLLVNALEGVPWDLLGSANSNTIAKMTDHSAEQAAIFFLNSQFNLGKFLQTRKHGMGD